MSPLLSSALSLSPMSLQSLSYVSPKLLLCLSYVSPMSFLCSLLCPSYAPSLLTERPALSSVPPPAIACSEATTASSSLAAILISNPNPNRRGHLECDFSPTASLC